MAQPHSNNVSHRPEGLRTWKRSHQDMFNPPENMIIFRRSRMCVLATVCYWAENRKSKKYLIFRSLKECVSHITKISDAVTVVEHCASAKLSCHRRTLYQEWNVKVTCYSHHFMRWNMIPSRDILGAQHLLLFLYNILSLSHSLSLFLFDTKYSLLANLLFVSFLFALALSCHSLFSLLSSLFPCQ